MKPKKKARCVGCRQELSAKELVQYKLPKAKVKLCKRCHAGVRALEQKVREAEKG